MSRISKAGSYAAALALILTLSCLGCGSKSGNSPSPPTISVTLNPSPTASMNLGSTLQFSAIVMQGKTTISTPVTYLSNNRKILSFGPNGLACAGSWDTAFIVCSPGVPGVVQVIASGYGTPSNSVTVYVHPQVTKIVPGPLSSACISQGQTEKFGATVLSGSSDITPFVGPVSWAAMDPNIAKTSTTASGLQPNQVQVTAGQPGLTQIYPSVSGVNGQAASFETCPVQSLSVLDTSTGTASVSLTKNTSTVLAATATDTRGQAINVSGLTWLSSQPGVATAKSGSITGVNPGGAAVFPVCAPPDCNAGLNVIYSANVISATVTGPASASQVYVSSTGCYGVSGCRVGAIPINTQSNSAGTGATLPAPPNSMVMDPTGINIYFGSATGLHVLSVTGNTFTSFNTGAGKVLAVSPGGTQEVVSDATSNPNIVYMVNSKTSAVTPLLLAGVEAAAFSPDGNTVYLLAGSTLYVYPSSGPLQTPIGLPGPATGAAFLTTGLFGFVATTPSTISLFDGCDYAAPVSPNTATVSTTSAPSLLASLPDGRTMVAVTPPGFTTVNVSSSAAGCPAPVSASTAFHDFGQGSFTPKQLLVSSDGKRLYVLSDLNRILVYDFPAAAVRIIPISNGATPLSAALTLSGGTLYVGASDGTVHVLDTSALADIGRVPVALCSNSAVSCPPDLVGLRP